MKTILFLLALLIGFEGYSQNYYAEDYAKGANVTFKCTQLSPRSYKLANSKNTKESLPIKYSDGSTVEDYKPIANPEDTKQLKRAIEETFTPEEIRNLKLTGRGMFIAFVINPQTARTEEVSRI